MKIADFILPVYFRYISDVVFLSAFTGILRLNRNCSNKASDQTIDKRYGSDVIKLPEVTGYSG